MRQSFVRGVNLVQEGAVCTKIVYPVMLSVHPATDGPPIYDHLLSKLKLRLLAVASPFAFISLLCCQILSYWLERARVRVRVHQQSMRSGRYSHVPVGMKRVCAALEGADGIGNSSKLLYVIFKMWVHCV